MTNNELFALAVELEEKRAQAMMSGNADELAQMLSDDLYYGHSGGYWDNKAGYIKKFREGTYAYRTVKANVEKAVLIADNAMMVHGEVTLEVNLQGIEKSMCSIYLAVWRREAEIWLFVAHQTALKQNG